MKNLLTVAAMLHVGCERTATSASVSSSGEETSSIGREDVEDTPGPASGEGTGDDIGGAMPEDVPVVPAICDPVQWSKDQRETFNLLPRSEDPPPVDENCVPVVDKRCETACDCKFIDYHCTLAASNVDVPWKRWVIESIGLTDTCEQLDDCDAVAAPSSATDSLECRGGICVAVGEEWYIRPIDLQTAE